MTTNTDAVPSTPAAQWRTNGKNDPFDTRYDWERATLLLGALTDDELANGVYLNGNAPIDVDRVLAQEPGYHPSIVWLTAAKDRIRWLSRALERALLSASKPAAPAQSGDPCQIDNFCGRVCQRGTRSCVADHAAQTDDARDAARYRWLRQQHWNEADMFVVAGSKSQIRLGADCPSLDLLDAAIDGAMSAEQSASGGGR